MSNINDPPPKPTYEVVLTVGGCDWETVARCLVDEARHIARHGPQCDACWGGAGTNGTVHITHRPGVTQDAYDAELHAWWMRSKADSTTPDTVRAR